MLTVSRYSIYSGKQYRLRNVESPKASDFSAVRMSELTCYYAKSYGASLIDQTDIVETIETVIVKWKRSSANPERPLDKVEEDLNDGIVKEYDLKIKMEEDADMPFLILRETCTCFVKVVITQPHANLFFVSLLKRISPALVAFLSTCQAMYIYLQDIDTK